MTFRDYQTIEQVQAIIRKLERCQELSEVQRRSVVAAAADQGRKWCCRCKHYCGLYGPKAGRTDDGKPQLWWSGQCRQQPPRVVISDVCGWPEVRWLDWCGQWEEGD